MSMSVDGGVLRELVGRGDGTVDWGDKEGFESVEMV